MKIAIIGAGLTGLVAGYRLSRAGYQVTVFEKYNDIGGLMGGFKIGNTSLEKAYHHIFKTDKHIIDLIKELGLESKLKWHPESMAIYYDGNIYPFVEPVDLLRFKPLDIVSKIRLGLITIWLKYDKDWKKYKNVLAYKWMQKWCGKKAYKIIWEPLLRGKFHDKYTEVSMAWLWARIHTRGNSGELGYLDGGFGQITDKLAEYIKDSGGKIKLNSQVEMTKIEKDFDKVLYTGAVKEINYLGFVGLIFTSSQSLSKIYWHNINDLKSPFLAFIQHTNLVDKKYYDGKNVYYLGTYLPHNHKYFQSGEEVVIKEWFEYLSKILPTFNMNLVEKTWVFKLKNAQHIVTTDYRVPGYKVADNIWQASFSQIFPEDRGTNYAVREGEKVAEMMSD